MWIRTNIPATETLVISHRLHPAGRSPQRDVDDDTASK